MGVVRIRIEDAPHVVVERAMLEAALPLGAVVLEAGCGRTSRLDVFRDRITRLVGVDLDPAARENLVADEVVAADLCGPLPFTTGEFDAVYANFVVEHLAQPEAAFREWRRLLKPGGQVVLLASNVANPILSVARALPERARVQMKGEGAGAAAEDVFPAVYRANTPARLRAAMARAGFVCEDLRCVGTLHRYAGRRRAARALLAACERSLPSRLRSTMIARFRAV